MGRIFGEFVGLLLLVGFIGAYLWWIIAAVVAVALIYFARGYWLAECRRAGELRAEHARIAARADQQHAWALAGDERGVYGEWPPASAPGMAATFRRFGSIG